MAPSPPPAPKPYRFTHGNHRSASLSPTVGVANRRGLGPGGQPRQSAVRRPRPAVHTDGSGRERSMSTPRRRRSFSTGATPEPVGEQDSEGGGDENGNDDDYDEGGVDGEQPTGSTPAIQPPLGNSVDNPILISPNGYDSSSFDDDDDDDDDELPEDSGEDLELDEAQQRPSRAWERRLSDSPLTSLEKAIAEPATPPVLGVRNPGREPSRSRTSSARRSGSGSRRSERNSPRIPGPSASNPQSGGDDDRQEEEEGGGDDLYDATPKSKSLKSEYYMPISRSPKSAYYTPNSRGPNSDDYPLVDTPLFSRQAGEQLNRELQQSIEQEPGPRPRPGLGNAFFGLGLGRLFSGAGKSTEQARDRPGHGPSRSGIEQQRGQDRQQRQNTDDLPDYEDDSAQYEEHPAVKKLDDCEKDRADLQEALDQALKDANEFEEQKCDLQWQLGEMTKERDDLQAENDALRAASDTDSPEIVAGESPDDVFEKPDDASPAAGDDDDALKECKRAKKRLRRQIAAWKDIAKRAEGENRRLQDEYADQAARYRELQDKLDEQVEQNVEWQTKLAAVGGEYDLSEAEKNNLRTEVATLEQRNGQLEQRIEELEQEVRELRERPNIGLITEDECDKRRKEEVDSLKARIAELEAHLANTEGELETSEFAGEAMEELRDELDDKLREQRAWTEELQERNAFLEREVIKLRERTDEKLITEDECDERRREEVDSLNARIAELETRLFEAVDELDTTERDELDGKLRALQQRYDGIEKRLEDCQEHRKGTDQHEEQLRQEFIDRETELASTIDGLQAQLRDANARLNNAEGTSSPSRKRKRNSSSSRSDEDVRTELEAQVQNLRDVNAELDAQVEQFKADLEDCRKHRRDVEDGQTPAGEGNDEEDEEEDEEDEADEAEAEPPVPSESNRGRGRGGGTGGRGGRGGRGRGRGGRKTGSKPASKAAASKAPRKSTPKPPPAKSTHTMEMRKR
ncbi:uncharacterized protein CLAFUR5_00413 [Fulvia fulva]|uniref:Uncharacterized protein n=1 Tax=Passalora fulva TaxID=5499 RepID=A0A9Q8L8Y3_PASFU|nr:uncharacterized protein CLAFUR5_00413 [Fulvia fulva]UJO13027.1 hypothetical protein CLAFUR5_00413 [Fulvia fulva]